MDSRDKSYQNASRAKGIEMWFGNVGALTGAAVVSVRNSLDASVPIRFTPTPTRARMGATRI